MARDLEGMESYQDELARAQISGLQGHQSTSLSPSMASPIYRPTKNDIEQQQRLLEQHQRETV